MRPVCRGGARYRVPVTWSDFDLDSALERDVLRRALPLVPTVSDGSRRVTVDRATGRASVNVELTDTLGPTPEGCVDLLAIRPLLLGAAWKVIDLLLEAALDEAGQRPSGNRGRWSIDEKIKKAKKRSAQPAPVDAQTWDALMGTYVATKDLRHSLVHRRVYTNASNELVGRDDNGLPLRPLSPVEQEALARAALRAAELVTAATPDPRVRADLVRQLVDLRGLNGVALPAVPRSEVLPEITVIIDSDPDAPGKHVLDVPALAPHRPAHGYADLVITARDRSGQQLLGQLENAPDQRVSIDFDNPPRWLS